MAIKGVSNERVWDMGLVLKHSDILTFHLKPLNPRVPLHRDPL